MNIYAKEGHKVVFSNPDNGYRYDQEVAKKHLQVSKEYTVDHTDVGGSSTNVYLKEVPGVSFNSVLFEDAKSTQTILKFVEPPVEYFNDKLKFSRIERFVHYLSEVVDRETALKVYVKLDLLPDKVLELTDEAIYEDLEFDGVF